MKFLNVWNVAIDKLPAYSAFKKQSTIPADAVFLKRIYNSELEEFTPDRKQLLLPVINAIDKQTNKLTISYSQRYGLGRFYPKNSISLICTSRHIKHTYFNNFNWIDLDMVKGHPTILYCMAMKNGLELPAFKKYIDNPNEIFDTLIQHYSDPESEIALTNDNVKDIFNISVYGGSHNTWLKQMDKENISIADVHPHPFVNEFITECKTLIDIIYYSNPEIKKKVMGDLTDEYKIKTRVMSYFCGTIENDIVYTAYKVLEKKKIVNLNNCLLEYDGICFIKPTEDIDYDALLDEINDKIFKESKLNVKMKWKPYNPSFVHTDKLADDIHSDTDSETNDTCDDETADDYDSFEKVSEVFELHHCKIVNKSNYIKSSDNKIIIMSRTQLKTAYENMIYTKAVTKYIKGNPITEYVTKNFINDWLVNNPSQRSYMDIGCYPRGLTCPSNHFNVWTPFDMELIREYKPNAEALQFFLNHLKIICNNDIPVYEYFLKWIAQMIQYPAIKSNCPVFISNEGAGKSSILRMFEKMFGSEKCFETANPLRDVWGDFNGRMANTFLVNLNELSKKDTLDSIGRIKALITDPKLTINNKGVSQYDIMSPHRFIMTTNNEEPIESKNDDRRLWVIRCSDELIGNKDYFKKLYEYIDNMDAIKTLFEFFFTFEDMKDFNKLEKPVTEYQKELQSISVNPIELWLKDFTESHSETDFVKLDSKECYDLFCEWTSSNSIEYHCNAIKFGVRLMRIPICKTAVETIKKKSCYAKQFDIEKLKKHFGIGCLLIESGE